jgi:hypothetical protein
MSQRDSFAENLNSLDFKTGLFKRAIYEHGAKKVGRAMNFALTYLRRIEDKGHLISGFDHALEKISGKDPLDPITDNELSDVYKILADLRWKYTGNLDYWLNVKSASKHDSGISKLIDPPISIN